MSTSTLLAGAAVLTGLALALANIPRPIQRQLDCLSGEFDQCYHAGSDSKGSIQIALWERACDGTIEESLCFYCNEACRGLAKLYRGGDGVDVDARKADLLLMRACEHGGSDACYELALHYDGIGSKLDALEFHQKACSQGHYEACAEACGRSHAESCSSIGEMLDRELGGRKLRDTWRHALESACKSGVPEGCAELPVAPPRGD